MATKITLNIMDNEDKKKIGKVYEADGYDLLMGTVEDFMDIIDVDKINDRMELMKMVIKCMDQIKPLIKDVFPELTDEEFKLVRVNDLVNTIGLIGASVVENLDFLKREKN